jgi:hypothetical protein
MKLLMIPVFWPVFWFTAAVTGEPEAEARWRSAVRLAAENRGWVAGRVEIAIEELDGEGRPGRTRRVTRLFPPPPGPGEPRPAPREASGARLKLRTGPHPFLEDVQARLQKVALEVQREIDGSACQGYRYRFREPGGPEQAGEAWLTVEDGAPVEIAYRLLPPPEGLDALEIRVRWARTPEGAWRRASMVATGLARGVFSERRTRATFSFLDYWRRPPR